MGDFQSDFDEDADAREREETKRLLYVALTRARDRLYLASATRTARSSRGPGSLGDVLPASIGPLFESANAATDVHPLVWTAPSGRRHAFRVCAEHGNLTSASRSPFEPSTGTGSDDATRSASTDDFGPLSDPHHVPRAAATDVAAISRAGDRSGRPATHRRSQAVVGIVVHRLFQQTLGTLTDTADLASLARAAVREELARGLEDREPGTTAIDLEAGPDPPDDQDAGADAAEEALDLFARMRSQPDVRQAFDGNPCLFEVPFSHRIGPDALPPLEQADVEDARRTNGVVVRGVIDCLVFRSAESVLVVDFKTGSPKSADGAQLGIYLAAVRVLFPGRAVAGLLVYADHTEWAGAMAPDAETHQA